MDGEVGGSAFFCNRECSCFPCHPIEEGQTFNCLFCYCPLYSLGEDCGGNFSHTRDGLKDCSACAIPHLSGGFDFVMSRIGGVLALSRKKSGGAGQAKER